MSSAVQVQQFASDPDGKVTTWCTGSHVVSISMLIVIYGI
jgi:hypothetical protein